LEEAEMTCDQRTMMWRPRLVMAALSLACSLGLTAAVPPAHSATDGVIVVKGKGKRISFGGFRPDVDPSPTAAGEVFGAGTARSQTDSSCVVDYAALGVTVHFADFGAPGVPGCVPGVAKAQQITAWAPGWATGRGLAIGDPFGKLKALYREKRLRKHRYELIGRRSPITVSGHQTVLSAFVHARRVSALRVWAGAAGD
jgi:hypothetical protein